MIQFLYPLLAAADDIRGIRPPIPLPVPTPWGLWLAVGVGALALAAAGFFLWQHRSEQRLGLTDRTLARLEEARADASTGDAYAFAIHISEILRHYLEARFGLRATQQTTPEFLRDLGARQVPELEGDDAALLSFLESCDAAKYARYDLGRARMDAMVTEALRFVEATRPAPAHLGGAA